MYKTIADLPPPVKANLPAKAQEIFLAAYNSAWKQHRAEDKAEITCNSIAWASVKKSFDKNPKGEWIAKESFTEGGDGSGNFGHAGIPGEVGGSAPGGGGPGGSEGTKLTKVGYLHTWGQRGAPRHMIGWVHMVPDGDDEREKSFDCFKMFSFLFP